MDKYLIKLPKISGTTTSTPSTSTSHVGADTTTSTPSTSHVRGGDGDGHHAHQSPDPDANSCFPCNSDLVHDPFTVPSCRNGKDEYIRRGPIRPLRSTFPFTTFGDKRRSFQVAWYSSRPWLEYNDEKDAALCFACRIFGPGKYDPAFQSNGFRLWSKALDKGRGFDKHSNSKVHLECMEKWASYLKQLPVDMQLNEDRRRQLELGTKERQQRRDVLPILLDITNTLGRLRLPFRGHKEGSEAANKGVFLGITNLVARWNKPLEEHLKRAESSSRGYPSYTSPKSQNEMIHSASQVIRASIASEVREAKYFAISVDTTTDASNQEQLSFILRYVNNKGEVQEALLDMEQAAATDAATLFTKLETLLQRYQLSMADVRGQGYDGCAANAGKYNGLQARVKAVTPKAYFVHCYAHRLNLVIVDSCSQNPTARNFFGIVAQLYNFMEASAKRHGLFMEVQSLMTEGRVLSLRSLSSTRWSCRNDSWATLQKTLSAVMATLQRVTEAPQYDRETASTALAMMKTVDFEFCLCLTMLTDLLQLCNVVSQNLQSETCNISVASSQVKAQIAELESRRNDQQFQAYWEAAEKLAEGMDITFTESRQRKISRRVDSNRQNEAIMDDKHRLKVNVFYQILDHMLSALRIRFSDDVLPLLTSIKALENPCLEYRDALLTLARFYEDDVDADQLTQEYTLFCRARKMGVSSAAKQTLHSIYLAMVDGGDNVLYPQLSRLYQLVLTLPVTSASCERSFSALKFVKNKLRTTMGQQRLSDLMVIAVEAKRSTDLPLTDCVEYFWNEFPTERR